MMSLWRHQNLKVKKQDRETYKIQVIVPHMTIIIPAYSYLLFHIYCDGSTRWPSNRRGFATDIYI